MYKFFVLHSNLLFPFILLFILFPISTSGASSEFLALYDFFDATNGFSTWLPNCRKNWNFTCLFDSNLPCANPCSTTSRWYGISCSGGNVSAIRLSSCQLSGYLPQEALNKLQVLHDLTLSINNLTSAIPLLTEIPDLNQLLLDVNKFTGQIPILPKTLLTVSLNNNLLTGTLPDSLGNISSLISFAAQRNSISGTIPPGLFQLSQIRSISLNFNNISGDIPPVSSLCNTLNLQNNALDGTFPTFICTETCFLNSFNVAHNRLYGNLNETVWQYLASSIRTFDISYNSITGSIPESFSVMSRLSDIVLIGNMLSGPLDTLLTMTRFSDFDVSNNYFTGPLYFPPTMPLGIFYFNVSDNLLSGSFIINYTGRTSGLFTIDVSKNFLTGSIPVKLNQSATNLQSLVMGSNFFTSPIPLAVATLPRVIYLDLSNNLLTGTMPPELFNISGVCFDPPACLVTSIKRYLFLHQNFLSGVIPSNLGSAKGILQLSLFDNMLTGTIPRSIEEMYDISTILLQKNRLTGNPGVPFANHSNFFNLQVVDIGDNKFSGSIPVEFFRLPNLIYFAITKGCYDGGIPPDICEAKMLRSLILEGISAGSECNTKVWDPFKLLNEAYFGDENIRRTIPSCIWNMSTLETLHLSGNGITGQLPDTSAAVVASLQDISLSFNQMTGSIPSFMQSHPFSNFDMSHNKLSGFINDLNADGYLTAEKEGEDSQFHININRFSGEIPKSARTLKEIDILAGNIWSCNQRDDLPRNDPIFLEYVCGSRTFDISLLFWASSLAMMVAFCFLLFFLYTYYSPEAGVRYSSRVATCCRWFSIRTSLVQGCEIEKESDDLKELNDSKSQLEEGRLWWLTNIVEKFKVWDQAACSSDPNLNPELCLFLQSLIDLRILAATLAALIIALYSPLYSFGKSYFGMGTHARQYRWLISAAYFSSFDAGIWMISFYFLVITAFVFQVCYSNFSMQSLISNIRARSGSYSRVSIPSAKSTRVKKILITLGLLSFNCALMLFLKCGYVVLLHYNEIRPSTQVILQFTLAVFDVFWNMTVLSKMVLFFPKLLTPSARIQIRLFGLIFNQIIAPVIATALTDKTCFSELIFTEVGSIETSTSTVICVTLDRDGVCSSFATLSLSTSFQPAFSYNYQCSSAVFTFFMPVLMFTCALTTFLLPFLTYVLINFAKKNYLNSSLALIPSILWPTRYREDEFNKVILAEILLSSMLGYVAMILTFGIVSPIVALAVAIVIYIGTWQWHLIIGRYLFIFKMRSNLSSGDRLRYLSNSADKTTSSSLNFVKSQKKTQIFAHGVGLSRSVFDFHYALEAACKDSWLGAMKSAWIICSFSAFFISLLLIDVSGDDVGLMKTVYFLVIPVMAFSLVVNLAIKRWIIAQNVKKTNVPEETNELDILADTVTGNNDDEISQNMFLTDRAGSKSSVSTILSSCHNYLRQSDIRDSVLREHYKREVTDVL